MKKLSVKKEVLTIIMIIVAVLAIGSKVFATGPIQINITDTTTPTVDTNEATTNEATTNTTTVTPVTTNTTTVAPTTNVTGSTYQNTTLPQTGDASDYAIFMLIVVAAVIAIYAYKKVRDYNI